MSELEEELVDVNYEVTIWVRESDPSPTESEIQMAIYRGVPLIESEDSVDVIAQ